jgi:rod shape determining protein RodA
MLLKKFKNIDWILYAVVFLLLILSVILIFSLTYHSASREIFYDQIVFIAGSIVVMFLFQVLDYRYLKNISWILYVIGILGLVIVFFLGKNTFGATRWIDLGFFKLQPSEFFKVIIIVSLSAYLSQKEILKLKELIFSLLMVAFPMILVLLQPDMGTAIVIGITSISIIIATGLKKVHLFSLAGLLAFLLPMFWFFLLKPYQKERIVSFMNPQADPFGSGYHVLQSIIAVGSGLFFGKGLGKGYQSQLNFLPAPHTDFIFAVLAEGLGLFGVLIILFLFAVLIYRLFKAMSNSTNKFGYLICVGGIAFFVSQILINIGMNLGIAPVTGIPLPFVSYGGSHILVGLILIGIVQSIISKTKKIDFN